MTITFKFKTKDKALKQHFKKTTYSVYEAVHLIEALPIRFKQTNETKRLDILIYKDEHHILKDSLTIGQTEVISYFAYLSQKIKIFKDNDQTQAAEDIAMILEMMRQEYEQESLEKEHLESYQQHQAVLSEGDVIDHEIELEETTTTFNPFGSFNYIKEGFFRLYEFCLLKKRRVMMIVMISGMIGIISMLMFSFYFNNGVKESVSEQPENVQITSDVLNSDELTETIDESVSQDESEPMASLDELLDRKDYMTALEWYPQEYPKIERTIFYLGVDGIPYLEEFLNKVSYPKGHFDLYYLKKDYKKVIELKDEADNDERLTQLAVAYVKTGNIQEGEKINQILTVPSLNTLIFKAKEQVIFKLIAEGKVEEAEHAQSTLKSRKVHTYFEERKTLENKRNDIQQALDKTPEDEQLKRQLKETEKELSELVKKFQD